MGSRQNTKSILNETILKEIRDAVDSLEYGAIIIKVHNKKIIQIEVTEKKRFDNIWKLEEGGGI